jgi:hypothetical protein
VSGSAPAPDPGPCALTFVAVAAARIVIFFRWARSRSAAADSPAGADRPRIIQRSSRSGRSFFFSSAPAYADVRSDFCANARRSGPPGSVLTRKVTTRKTAEEEGEPNDEERNEEDGALWLVMTKTHLKRTLLNRNHRKL